MRTSVLTLWACLLPGCVWTGNGVAKQEERSLGAFDTIEATDIVDVVVREGGPVDGVSVYCDENVIEMLETRVSGGILSVGFRGGSVSTSTACEVVTGNMDIVEIISLGISDITVEGPVWSLDTIRSESVGNITVDLRPAQLETDPAEDSGPLLEGSEGGPEGSRGVPGVHFNSFFGSCSECCFERRFWEQFRAILGCLAMPKTSIFIGGLFKNQLFDLSVPT